MTPSNMLKEYQKEPGQCSFYRETCHMTVQGYVTNTPAQVGWLGACIHLSKGRSSSASTETS